MRFWKRPTLTDAERQREIARLEAVRDRLLEHAERFVAFRHLFAPAVFILFAALAGIGIATHPGKQPILLWLVFAAAVFLVGRMVLRDWRHPLPKGDLWGYADTIAYDGDSPRDIQQKIDDLRGRRRPDPEP